jgi:hypothetical protein
LVPPSVVNSATYTWQREMEGTGTPLLWSDVQVLLQPPAMAPSAPPLRRMRTAGSQGRHGLAPLVRHVLRLQPGQRNNGLFLAACRAGEEGHVDLSTLLEAGQHIGLSHDEAQGCIESACSTVAAAA